MKIVANTKGGVLIEATNDEVKAILHSVTGNLLSSDELVIGVKIPAIDYAATITNIKQLQEDSYFKDLSNRVKSFSSNFKRLEESVENASKIGG